MQIAFVTDYSLDLIGGAQRAMLNEAAALRAAGHGVVLVAPRPRHTHTLEGVPLWIDAPRVPGIDFALITDSPDLRMHLRRRFLTHAVDAVHVHSEFGLALAATATAHALGIRVLHTVHTAYWPRVPSALGPLVEHGLRRLTGPVPRASGHPLLDRTVAEAHAADIVISPSAHQAEDLRRLGVRDVAVLPNCGAGQAHPSMSSPAGALHVAWVGRCVPEKRLLPFVRAVRMAARRLPAGALRVTVAGDGPLLPVARLLGAGVPWLRLVGRLDPAGVRELLSTAHLAALTSHGFDNQPMTVVEAVRAGCGVLYVDERLTEGLDRAGVLASPDPASMADALVALAHDSAPVLAARAGATAGAALFDPALHAASWAALACPQPLIRSRSSARVAV